MTEFLNRPLSAVTRIFRLFNGESQRSALDLSAAMQPVYDYSRQSELGSRGVAAGGYLYLGQTLTHAIADTQFASTNPTIAFDSIFEFSDFDSGGARQHRLWLVDVFANLDDPGDNFTAVRTGWEINAVTPPRLKILAMFDKAAGALTSGGDLPCFQDESGPVAQGPFLQNGPYLFDSADEWVSVSVSSGTLVTRVHSIWWAGPLGTTPPGMR